MVATSGKGWKLAPCLVAMEAEADELAPKRSDGSDGSIGDQAHAERKSGHNPDNGWVCALDLTHDPGGGFDAHARARTLIAGHDPRVRFVISNRQVARSYWSAVTSRNRPVNPAEAVGGRIPPWCWAHYSGSNPHVAHAHFEVPNTAATRDDRSPWWPSTAQPPAVPQEDDHMLTVIIHIYEEHEGVAGSWLNDPAGVEFWERHGRKVGVKQLIGDMLGAIWAAASKR